MRSNLGKAMCVEGRRERVNGLQCSLLVRRRRARGRRDGNAGRRASASAEAAKGRMSGVGTNKPGNASFCFATSTGRRLSSLPRDEPPSPQRARGPGEPPRAVSLPGV